MKSIHLCFLMFTAIIYSAIGQKTAFPFHIQGKIEGQLTGELYLTYTLNKTIYKDSCIIQNDKFFFKNILSEPVRVYLTLKEKNYNPLHSVGFFLEPGKIKIKLYKDDFSKSKIRGSEMQRESEQLARSKEYVIKKYQVQIDSLNKETDDEKRNAVRERLAPYFMEVNKISYEFFSKHPSSYFTAYYLRFYLQSLSIDSLLMFYSRLAPPVKESEFGKFLKSKIDLLTAGSPGAVASNFSKKDINKVDISLTGFRGKYVLLDFWASWCIPCRKNSPALRILYSKYNKSGLEIIGVSDNDSSPDAWRQAVAQDSLPWWHVLRGLDPNKKRRNERNDNDINENFGISELPTYILINPEGIIIARYQENMEAIRNDLQKIFGY